LPRPEYPQSLRSAGVAGTVVVQVTIGADGKVQDVTPIDAPKMLWAAVVPAADQAIFQCHHCRDGSARYVVVYEFKLRTTAPFEARQPAPVFNGTRARVTVIGQGRRVIANDVPREEVRAVRCLWLWHCGLRPRD
jgi:TonB family protein